MRIRYYKRITVLCLVFSLVFTCACYADEIIEGVSFDGVMEAVGASDVVTDNEVPEIVSDPVSEPVPAPVAGAEKDLAEIFDLEKITTVSNEGDTIADIIPAAKPAEPVSESDELDEDEPEQEHNKALSEMILYSTANEGAENTPSSDLIALSASSNKALYDLLDCLSANSISINEALNEQRILIEGIKEQLSKDSKRDSSYQKEIKQYLMAITSSLSVDLARSISADDIHVNVTVDSVSSSSVSGDTVSDDTVSEDGIDENLSANRLYIAGASSDLIPVKLSSDEVLTVSVSNVSGNDISSSAEYLRNIFYVLIIMAIFLAMITAMMIEQIFFKRLHG